MKILAGGAQTYSKGLDRYGIEDEVYAIKAFGPYVYLDSGEQLVDLTSGMGSVILGHCDLAVNARVGAQLAHGTAYPIPSRLEEDAAHAILKATGWGESVRFAKNGADVTGAAVKLARWITGRLDVAYLDYHGHHPWSTIEPPMNGGTAQEFRSRRLPRDPNLLLRALSREFACVVLEPWPSNMPGFEYGEDFWASLRTSCDDKGILIILDEMVSGFRCGMGGGREALGIEPDLVCYGKALGNGHAVSALVGSHYHMREFEDRVFFSTTHGGEQSGLAAAHATMVELHRTSAHDRTRDLGIEIISHCLRLDLPVKYSYPQRLVFPSLGDQGKAIMRAHGVLCAGYANLTLAHSSVLDVIMNALEAVAKEI